MVWGMLLSISGTMAIALSLAEMASICPIAGAQYHWTALFAPPRMKSFMTWMQGEDTHSRSQAIIATNWISTGWITVFAWQAAATSICFLVATQIQGLIVLNYPNYVFERWHGTLLMWAVMIITFGVNVYAIKILPALQLVGGIFHVTFFVAIVVPLVLLSPRSTPQFVFTELLNKGGWESDGISWCIGLLSVTYCFLGGLSYKSSYPIISVTDISSAGFDGAIHMSEEVRNAAVVIPKILVQTIVINGTLAFVFIIVLLFCVGDVDRVLHSPTHYPIIEIFYQTTGSVSTATALQSLIILIGVTSNIGVVASVSRLTWAFARDGGLPFSEFFAHVSLLVHLCPYSCCYR